jgi:hypothetical protein
MSDYPDQVQAFRAKAAEDAAREGEHKHVIRLPVTDEDIARALWAEDGKVNTHGVAWEAMDEGTQALFLAYARVAREMLGERTMPFRRADELKG